MNKIIEAWYYNGSIKEISLNEDKNDELERFGWKKIKLISLDVVIKRLEQMTIDLTKDDPDNVHYLRLQINKLRKEFKKLEGEK